MKHNKSTIPSPASTCSEIFGIQHILFERPPEGFQHITSHIGGKTLNHPQGGLPIIGRYRAGSKGMQTTAAICAGTPPTDQRGPGRGSGCYQPVGRTAAPGPAESGPRSWRGACSPGLRQSVGPPQAPTHPTAQTGRGTGVVPSPPRRHSGRPV